MDKTETFLTFCALFPAFGAIMSFGFLFITPWKINLKTADSKTERIEIIKEHYMWLNGFYFCLIVLIPLVILIFIN